MVKFLLSLLRSPSGFRFDPWGYLRNQTGHAYIVGGGLSFFIPVWAVIIIYGAWETIQMIWFKSELWDSLDDMVHVMLIAIAVSSGMYILVPVQIMLMWSGYLQRKQQLL